MIHRNDLILVNGNVVRVALVKVFPNSGIQCVLFNTNNGSKVERKYFAKDAEVIFCS